MHRAAPGGVAAALEDEDDAHQTGAVRDAWLAPPRLILDASLSLWWHDSHTGRRVRYRVQGFDLSVVERIVRMILGKVSSRQIRWLAVAAVLGGLLWIPYGVFEMLEPWGTDTVYRDDLGYEVITDSLLFVAYSLPGGLALLLTSLGLVGVLALLKLPAQRVGRIGRALAYVAVALALLSIIGVLVLFDPVFTSGRIFGSLALGAATLLAGIDARARGSAASWTVALVILGLMGLFLFPLWPLVHALELVPEGVGAAFIVAYGVGWTLMGYRLYERARLAWCGPTGTVPN